MIIWLQECDNESETEIIRMNLYFQHDDRVRKATVKYAELVKGQKQANTKLDTMSGLIAHWRKESIRNIMYRSWLKSSLLCL